MECGEIYRVDYFEYDGGNGVADVDILFESIELFLEHIAYVDDLWACCMVVKHRSSARIGGNDKGLH
jgi:hypothetical protein